MKPAGSRENIIGIMIDQVDQNGPAGAKGDKIRVMFEQVDKNVTSWCQERQNWYHE
jgi:hypothetical protein